MLPWQPFFRFLYMGAYWRHLANTTEPSVYGGDAGLCQNYFDQLLLLGCIIAVLCLLLQSEKRAWSVFLSATIVSPGKTAEPIEMPFGTREDPRKHVLDWRHLASTIVYWVTVQVVSNVNKAHKHEERTVSASIRRFFSLWCKIFITYHCDHRPHNFGEAILFFPSANPSFPSSSAFPSSSLHFLLPASLTPFPVHNLFPYPPVFQFFSFTSCAFILLKSSWRVLKAL